MLASIYLLFYYTIPMRILVALAVLLSLASCTTTPVAKPIPPITTPVATPSSTGTTPVAMEKLPTTTPTETATSGVASTGSIVTLNYTLRSDSETGPIEETTSKDIAVANNIVQTGAAYQPFQVALGQGNVIFGFEKGLMGVKKGEHKTIKVIPSEGYGRPVAIPKEKIAPEFTLTRDKKMFDNTLTQTMEKNKFPKEMQDVVNAAKVGSTLTGANNAVAKVVEVTDTTITLSIENSGNPFYKKELKVGTTATVDGLDFKITAIDGANITFDVINKQSPFYGKKFAPGESVSPTNGNKITIQEIGDTSVTILIDHKFMSKDLYFDVDVLDVQ